MRHRRLLRKRLPLRLINLVIIIRVPLSLVFLGDVIGRLLVIELEFHHREEGRDDDNECEEHQTSSCVARYPRPRRRKGGKKITTIRTSNRYQTI